MLIDKTQGLQAKIPNGNYIDLTPYLVEVKYEYPKLFADGSGRNLAGTMSADFIGVFVKITCSFGPLNKTQLELITPILDSPTQVVRYYDPYKKAYVEMNTYSNDYSIIDKNIISGNTTNEGFDITFIAISKRV